MRCANASFGSLGSSLRIGGVALHGHFVFDPFRSCCVVSHRSPATPHLSPTASTLLSSSPAIVIFWLSVPSSHPEGTIRDSLGEMALCQGPYCGLSILSLALLEHSTARLWDILEPLATCRGSSSLNIFKNIFTHF